MALRLYLDDCAASNELRDLLRGAGHEVRTPSEAGLQGRNDPIHFAYAIQEGLILVTMNPADFLALHQANSQHPGMLAVYRINDVTRDMDPAAIVQAVAALEQAYSAANTSLANGFHNLNQWRGVAGPATSSASGRKRRPKK